MCLDAVSNRKVAKTGIGYKVVGPRRFGPNVFEPLAFGSPIVLGKWMDAGKRKKMLRIGGSGSGLPIKYECGFHIYMTRKAGLTALNVWGESNLLKVEYTGAHTRGVQDNLPVVIARRMRAIKVIRKA